MYIWGQQIGMHVGPLSDVRIINKQSQHLIETNYWY
jgi:hypothetical protein